MTLDELIDKLVAIRDAPDAETDRGKARVTLWSVPAPGSSGFCNPTVSEVRFMLRAKQRDEDGVWIR